MHPDDRARDLKVKEIVLGNHQKARKDIIQVEQPLRFSNLPQKVLSRSNLPIFQSGHKFAINANISDSIMSNYKRSIEEGSLLTSNISRHISQYIICNLERPIVVIC